MSGSAQLSGQQVRQILDAILSGFDRSDLRAMTRIELDQELDDIAGGESLQDVGLALIAWAEREGKTRNLIAAIGRYNPDNPQVRALVRDAAGWFTSAGQASDPAAEYKPYLVPPPPQANARVSGWVKVLVPLLMLGVLGLAALAGRGILQELTQNLRPNAAATTPGTTPVATGVVTVDPSLAVAPATPTPTRAATAAAAPAADTAAADPPAAATPAATGQPLQVGYADQRWVIGDVAYQLLDVQAARLAPAQTRVDLRLRLINNGQYDTSPEAERMRLIAGEVAAAPVSGNAGCDIQVQGQAARDDCRVSFLIDSAAEAMTLVLAYGDVTREVALTFSPAAASAPAPAPSSDVTVALPVGVWAQGPLTWQFRSASAEPGSVEPGSAPGTARSNPAPITVTLRLSVTNTGVESFPLWSSNLRLVEDDLQRAPAVLLGDECTASLDPITTLSCTAEFVVGSGVQELTLRSLPTDGLPELLVPIPLSRTTP